MKTSWRSHYKYKLVKRLLGAEGIVSVYSLWAFAAENKTDGDLTGMSNLEIAVAADWEGDPEALVGVLVQVKLLDGATSEHKLHDWVDHNPYVSSHESRSVTAKQNAHRRWQKEGKTHKKTEWCDSACKVEGMPKCQPTKRQCNPDAPFPDPFPDPSPSPSPKKKKDAAVRQERPLILEAGDSVFSSIQDHYVRVFPGRKAQTETKAIKRLVGALLAKGYSAIDLMTAIDGCSRSEWHLMHGHTSLAFIVKDAARLDSFISKTLPVVTAKDMVIAEARARDEQRQSTNGGELPDVADSTPTMLLGFGNGGGLAAQEFDVPGEAGPIPASDILPGDGAGNGEAQGLVSNPTPIVGDSERS